MAGSLPAPSCPQAASRRASSVLSRNTVAEVYDRLSNEGLVVARQGSGTYVADLATGTRIAHLRRRAPTG